MEVLKLVIIYLIGDFVIGLPYDVFLAQTALSPVKDDTFRQLWAQVLVLLAFLAHTTLRPVFSLFVLQ